VYVILMSRDSGRFRRSGNREPAPHRRPPGRRCETV